MPEKVMQIKATDEDLKTKYSNVMNIQGGKEEFCLDFLSIFPPMGALVARIVINPGHLKRMVRVLEETLKNHEKQFGETPEAQEPEKPTIGFGSHQ